MLLHSSGDVPFRFWVFDNWYTPLTQEQMAEPASHTWEATYNNDIEHGKMTSRDFDNMRPELRTAFIKMRHPDTVRDFRLWSDIPTLMDDPYSHGAGLHWSKEDSYLNVHLDYNIHPIIEGKERRMNLIWFAHHEWKPEWGGQLLLADPMGKPVVEIDPMPGRLVAFECGDTSYHGVRVIKGNHQRLSCAVYLLANARPNCTRRRALFLPNRNSPNVPHEVQ